MCILSLILTQLVGDAIQYPTFIFFNYRTCAIITLGFYIFKPLFLVHTTYQMKVLEKLHLFIVTIQSGL